jgi:WD40-like Beta Propeller Repeat
MQLVTIAPLHMILLWATLSTLGCGAGSSSQKPPSHQTITIAAFTDPVPAGSPAFTAIADGSGYTPTTAVFWNGSELSTSYQTSGILYTNVPAALVANPGTASVFVKDTSTGTVSNTVTFAILSAAAANATVVQLVSSGIDGSAANGDSLVQPSISATGRFIVFQSAGTNLVTQQIITPWENIYLKDTCIGATTPCTQSTQLVSVSADGTSGGNWQSRASTVSQDGRYVAFDSGATNLLANTPSYCNNTTNCVYLRDTCMGVASGCVPKTILGSIEPGEVGVDGANPVLSPSGRYLAFASNGSPATQAQIYLRDWCVSAPLGCVPNTIPISINSLGAFANEGAQEPSVSGDGRFVGFVSYSTNLIDPTQPAVQTRSMMFVRDNCTGSTVACTPGVSRVDVPNGGGTADNSLDPQAIPSLSSTGRYISYSSNSTNLVSQNVQGFGNVYLRDTCVGATSCTVQNTLVSLGNDASIANSGTHQQSMSADGRYIAFTSIATNLVWGIPYPAGTWQDIYVRDTCTGAPAGCYPSTVRVAVTNTPTPQTPSNAGASLPAISADGHYVVFLSSSTNLTAAGTGGHSQVFLSKTGF